MVDEQQNVSENGKVRISVQDSSLMVGIALNCEDMSFCNSLLILVTK